MLNNSVFTLQDTLQKQTSWYSLGKIVKQHINIYSVNKMQNLLTLVQTVRILTIEI